MLEEEKKEKKDLLKREEIRTMAKDISRLREIEAEKERQKIIKLKQEKEEPVIKRIPEKEPGKEETKQTIEKEIAKEETPETSPEVPPKAPLETPPENLLAEKPKEETISLIPSPPKRPPRFQKVLIRSIICIGLILIVGLFVGLHLNKKPKPENQPSQQTEQPESKPENSTATTPAPEKEKEPKKEVAKIDIPPSLIPTKASKTFEISENTEITTIFNEPPEEKLPEQSFQRIIIINTKENKLASLNDIADAFQIDAPKEIFNQVDNKNYTLTIYWEKVGKRVSIISKVKVKDKDILANLLKDTEKKIEREGVLLSGKRIPSLVRRFRSISYKGVLIRFLTISRSDLGICYCLYNNYFILTTSLESISKIIDKLAITK